MSGRRTKTHRCLLVVVVLVAAGAFWRPVFAAQEGLRGEDFRLGLELGPAFKFVNGIGFAPQGGLIFKIKERISVIPQFELFPYSYEDLKWDAAQRNYVKKNESDYAGVANVQLTVRYEFLFPVVDTTTRFIYDPETRRFQHLSYYKPARPFVQIHAGTFVGLGGGVLRYITPQFAVGAGADLGWNLILAAGGDKYSSKAAFGIIAPRLLLILAI